MNASLPSSPGSGPLSRLWHSVKSWLGETPRRATKPTVRLTMERLEGREQPSVTPVHVAVGRRAEAVVLQQVQSFVVNVALAQATPTIHSRNLGPAVLPAQPAVHAADAVVKRSVTFLPPTARDRAIAAALANRKWQLVTTVTNPFTGGRMRIIAEVVFVRTGTFTLNQVGIVQGYFGPVRYYSGTAGIWRVQSNGTLILRNDHPYPAKYWAKYQFIRITSINSARFVSPDAGTWRQIPLRSTAIR